MVYTAANPRLTRKALVLAKIESTYGTDPTPSVLTDAVLVSDPDYSVDPVVLERNFVREDMSPLGTVIGRKLASLSFGMEFRSNGLTNSGSTGDAAILGRLLRSCGYAETGMTGNGTVDPVVAATTNTNDPTWAEAGSNAATGVSRYRITCVLGGASTTAKLRVTGGINVRDTSVLSRHDVVASVYRYDGTTPTITATVNDTDPLAVDVTIGGVFQAGDVVRIDVNGNRYERTTVSGDTDLTGVADGIATLINAHALIVCNNTAAVVNITYTGAGAGSTITSGSTALTLGESAMTLTPTWTGNLTLGDYWEVYVYPTGIKYEPVSSGFESITLYAYFDGLLHKLHGCYGTFSIDATAGNYATINFTFTGSYEDPVNRDVPSGVVHESSLPAIVELARCTLDNFQPVVNAFTFDQNNNIVVRPDVSSDEGYIGTRLTARDPQGGIDPESVYENEFSFWDNFDESTYMEFNMKIGQTAGNRIFFVGRNCQFTGLTYGNRDDIRTYDAGIRFARWQGNDETVFCFS